MVHNAQWTGGYGSSSSSRMRDKVFERLLVMVPETTPDRWEKIASQIPGMSAAGARKHYEDLVHDVMEIDSGRVELPRYENEPSSAAAKMKGKDGERRKGVPWTDKEHRLFLEGLKQYGKGDWRSISRNSVVTRTPTQVASHAQKYFLRLNSGSGKKEKKRSSIHDITTDDDVPVGVGQTHYQTWAGPCSSEPFDSFMDQPCYVGYHHGSGFPM